MPLVRPSLAPISPTIWLLRRRRPSRMGLRVPDSMDAFRDSDFRDEGDASASGLVSDVANEGAPGWLGGPLVPVICCSAGCGTFARSTKKSDVEGVALRCRRRGSIERRCPMPRRGWPSGESTVTRQERPLCHGTCDKVIWLCSDEQKRSRIAPRAMLVTQDGRQNERTTWINESHVVST